MAVLIGTETWDREETKRWLFLKEERKHGCPECRRQNDGCSQGEGDKSMAVPRGREETKRWGLPRV